MNKKISDNYFKIVEWSGEDNCYVGSAPKLEQSCRCSEMFRPPNCFGSSYKLEPAYKKLIRTSL
jgi:hypothetical protein